MSHILITRWLFIAPQRDLRIPSFSIQWGTWLDFCVTCQNMVECRAMFFELEETYSAHQKKPMCQIEMGPLSYVLNLVSSIAAAAAKLLIPILTLLSRKINECQWCNAAMPLRLCQNGEIWDIPCQTVKNLCNYMLSMIILCLFLDKLQPAHSAVLWRQ